MDAVDIILLIVDMAALICFVVYLVRTLREVKRNMREAYSHRFDKIGLTAPCTPRLITKKDLAARYDKLKEKL